jgi:hypothetical protein
MPIESTSTTYVVISIIFPAFRFYVSTVPLTS